ncbi:MAG: mechanosensitive ion channel family protein, partial [Deltaproteobacteria bacterium]|nr:mechanosensitive ion channel family protein [Deltaproteobacteria bacterium]
MDFSNILPRLQELLAFYGLKIVAAIIIFIVGRWIARALKNVIKRMMAKGEVDETLISFVGNLTYITLLAFVIIAALNQLGIQT